METEVGFRIKGYDGGLKQMIRGSKYHILVLCVCIIGENENVRKL